MEQKKIILFVVFMMLRFFNKTPPNFVTCKTCQTKIKFVSSHLHGSSLTKHVKAKHPDLLNDTEGTPSKVPKITNFLSSTSTELPSLSKLDRQAIAICASQHPLPFSVVDDEIFSWAFDCSGINRQKIATRISEIGQEWRRNICSQISHKLVSIMLDGWTNSVSHQHHICFIVKVESSLFYWSSKTTDDKSSSKLLEMINDVVQDIRESDGKVVCCVADNARNMQAALRALNEANTQIATIGCVAHVLNLLVGDVFSKVDSAKTSMKIVNNLVNERKLPRYTEIRWNSKFNAVKSALDLELCQSPDAQILDHCKQLLDVVSSAICQIQADNSNAKDVIENFSIIELCWRTNPSISDELKTQLEAMFSKRWGMVKSGPLGALSRSLMPFINLSKEGEAFLNRTTEVDSDKFAKWSKAILPYSRHDQFTSEQSRLCDSEILGLSVKISDFPVHNTLSNIFLSLPVSEAAVERAFSRHRLVHTNLRSRLSCETLDDELFIRYNMASMLKIKKQLSTVEEIHSEIQAWSDNVEDSLE